MASVDSRSVDDADSPDYRRLVEEGGAASAVCRQVFEDAFYGRLRAVPDPPPAPSSGVVRVEGPEVLPDTMVGYMTDEGLIDLDFPVMRIIKPEPPDLVA